MPEPVSPPTPPAPRKATAVVIPPLDQGAVFTEAMVNAYHTD